MRALSMIVALVVALLASGGAFGDEFAERSAIRRDVSASFEAGQFSKLDALAARYRTSKTRTSSGLWHLTLFYAGISDVLNAEPDFTEYWKNVERAVGKWVADVPDSPTARLVYARMLVRHGWSYRGSGYANTVTPQNQRMFEEYLTQARSYLEKHKTVASADPYWYELMAIIGYAQSWPEATFASLIAEGLRKEPLFYQTYFAAIDYYAPKWGGSAAAIEQFARDALERTRSIEGYGMYARIYWYASQTQYGDALFTESKVDWTAMKKGIDDVLAKYPDGWNVNNFARFACLARDKAKTAELMARIEGAPLMAVWRVPALFQQCKSWSAS